MSRRVAVGEAWAVRIRYAADGETFVAWLNPYGGYETARRARATWPKNEAIERACGWTRRRHCWQARCVRVRFYKVTR